MTIQERQIWNEAAERNKVDPIGWRYQTEQVRLTVAQTIQQWWIGLQRLEWNWSRTKTVLNPIKPGDHGYDQAPYEMSFIFKR